LLRKSFGLGGLPLWPGLPQGQATICGGHICLVLTPNGEINIFGDGVQLFNFFDGRCS
jgi:hypothetical protein